MTTDKVNATFRLNYDRLYVASMRANDAAESAAIDAKLAALNAWRTTQLERAA